MTTRPIPQCLVCRRLDSPLDTDVASLHQTCAAYPDGIPSEIWQNMFDHRQPHGDDQGLQWDGLDGMTFPEWALAGHLSAANSVKTYRIVGRPAGGLPFNVDPKSIDLSKVQDDWERQLERVLTAWVAVTADQRRQIVEQVRHAVNNDDLNAIAKISVTSNQAAEILTEAMNQMAATAAEAMQREAADQGVQIEAVPGHPELHSATAAAIAALLGAGLANAASRDAMRRYAPQASGDDVAAAVGEHLDGLSDAYLRDNLGNTLTGAQNDGRLTTALAGPEVALYSSEKMDKNTCAPCEHVNGKWLGNSSQMSMVYATYPNGGYVDCLGGPRCRGTIVAVYRPQQVDTNHGEDESVPVAP